jgi:ABC-type nitrate/sulfonate/bicarbonate transport system substrate-binding protein
MARFPILAAVAVAGLLQVAVPAGEAVAQSAPIKLDFAGSSTWLGQAPVLVAIKKGYFKDEGLDVTFRTILSSADRLRAVTSGDVAFSNLGRSSVIAAMAHGNHSFYFFANIDDSPGNEGCWARPGFASFKDLKGKKVAANTSAEITMAGLLTVAGMTEKDIQFVNLPPNEMAPALAKGDVDAACVWQPLLDGLKAAVPNGKLLGTDMDTAMYKKFGTMASPDIVIVSKKVADEHPKEAAKFAVALFKGADFVQAHPEETAKLISETFRKSPEQLLPEIKKFKYFGGAGWEKHMKLHEAQMQELSDWLAKTGKIPTKPDVKEWAKYSFLPKS